MSVTPVPIKTSFGLEQFSILWKQMEQYKIEGAAKEFKIRCLKDAIHVSEYLTFFLEDKETILKHPLDEQDHVGRRIADEMADIITALNYFGKRMESI